MILKPLRKEQFPCLTEIFKQRIIESNLQDRTTIEDLFRNLSLGYDSRTMGAYVDDVEKPNHCLIMSHFPGVVVNGIMAYISLIYSTPEHRSTENAAVLLRTAENYARLNGASMLLGSSWVYRGSQDTGLFWVHNGFEVQETAYIKHLI